MRRGAAGAALLAALTSAVAGCSSGTQIGSDSAVTVYLSMPLRGPSGPDGRDVADGARMALARAGGKAGVLSVHAVYLDDTRRQGKVATWSAAQVGANARKATEDSTSIAYIGDFESGATRTSEPITNQARLLQLSPASSAVDLTRPFAGSEELPDYEQASNERTFGRVIPDDDAQGRAAGAWARQMGAKRVAVDSDGSAFAKTVEAGFKVGLAPGRVDAHGATLRFFAGSALNAAITERGPAIPHEPARSKAPLMGIDALLPPWNGGAPPIGDFVTSAALDPSQLPSAGQKFVHDFRARYGREPGRYAAYGYEAMAVVLDSIDRASGDTISRQGVIDAFFNTLHRQSILGTYSIDAVGNTTLDRMTGYRVRGGQPIAVAQLRSR